MLLSQKKMLFREKKTLLLKKKIQFSEKDAIVKEKA